MHIDSRRVSSNQPHTNTRLPHIVRRHLTHRHQKPVAAHSRTAFGRLLASVQASPRPLVLDSFCGTGRSTAQLALRHPDHLVVGVDKSAHRLAKHVASGSDNYLLLQADCEDIWQLLLHAEMCVDYHYLLYPNPWPKSRHLQRRVHGSAAFPWLVSLGGRIELRSNWRIYVEEFGLAMHLANHCGRVFILPEAAPMTLFEEKYRASGHPLWVYVGDTRKTSQSDDTGLLS